MLRESKEKKIDKELIVNAIDSLKGKGWDINPYTVADEAKIARSALYRSPELMKLINEAKGGNATSEDEHQSAHQEMTEHSQTDEAPTAPVVDTDKVRELEGKLSAAENKLADAENKRADAENKLADAQNRLSEAESRPAEVEDKSADWETRLADANSKLADADSKLADADSKLADADSKLADAGSKLADAGSKLADAESKLTDVEGKLTDAKNKIAELEQAVTNLTEEKEAALEKSRKSWQEGYKVGYRAGMAEAERRSEEEKATAAGATQAEEEVHANPPQSKPAIDFELPPAEKAQPAAEQPAPIDFEPVQETPAAQEISPASAHWEPSSDNWQESDATGAEQTAVVDEQYGWSGQADVYQEEQAAPYVPEQSVTQYAPEEPVYAASSEPAYASENMYNQPEQAQTESAAAYYDPASSYQEPVTEPVPETHAAEWEDLKPIDLPIDDLLVAPPPGAEPELESEAAPGAEPAEEEEAPVNRDELQDLLRSRFSKPAVEEAPKETESKRAGTKFVGGNRQAQEPPPQGFVVRTVPPDIRKACLVLGLRPEELTHDSVHKAWKKEITNPGSHPDIGGDTEIAVYLNTAKDELYKWLDAQAPKLGKKFGSPSRDPKDTKENPKPDSDKK